MLIHVNHCSSAYYYEQGVGLKESEYVIFAIIVITTISNQKLISLQIDYLALTHATYTLRSILLNLFAQTKNIDRVIFRLWPILRSTPNICSTWVTRRDSS